MQNQPLVSVAMATFNEPPAMVTQAINSIIHQTYKNWELLIYDDSTQPETRAAIDACAADSRVQVHRAADRLGFVRSLNCGLRQAKGQYIARMDGDDSSLPERLAKEVTFLQQHAQIAVVGGQVNIMNGAGEIVSTRSYPVGGAKLQLFSAFRNPLAHPTIMMRRELVEAGFLYDEERVLSEDLDLWLRLLNHGYELANLPDTILNYRVADDFFGKRTGKRQRDYTYYVRKQNFSWRHPLRNSLSVAAGWLIAHGPVDMLRGLYSRENKS